MDDLAPGDVSGRLDSTRLGADLMARPVVPSFLSPDAAPREDVRAIRGDSGFPSPGRARRQRRDRRRLVGRNPVNGTHPAKRVAIGLGSLGAGSSSFWRGALGSVGAAALASVGADASPFWR